MRVLFVPSGAATGPYVSLERVADTTRAAIAERFELVELDVHPDTDPERYLAAFAAAAPLDAVVDLSDQALHGPSAPDIPSLFLALGNMPNGATFPWLRRRRLKTTDVLLMNCTSDLHIYERTLGGTGPAAELFPFGVDTDRFRPRTASENLATRRELGLADDSFVLAFAGRLNVQKNVHGLMQLLREVVPRIPKVELVLAGEFDTIGLALFDISNDGYEDHIRNLIASWGLQDRVHLAGKLGDEQLARLYSAADAFVSLTIHNNENFGYAPVEAMAAGTPAIGAHFGGLKDTIVHGATGYHVETAITDHGLRCAWRQAAQPLAAMARDPALVRTLGAAARARAEEHYSLAAFGACVERVVRRAVTRCRDEPGRPGATFRFAEPAQRLHLRNLYRTFTRAEGRKRARRGPRVEYELYRWFQGPYATRDATDLILADDDQLALVPICRLDRALSRLASLDPIWPRSYDLTSAELETIATIEPGATIADLLAAGRRRGLDEPSTRLLLGRLLAEGVLYPLRPFTAA